RWMAMTERELPGPLDVPAATAPSDMNVHLAYAEASVMLVECLMLVLIEKKLLPVADLVDAVETAIEAKQRLIKDRSHPQIATIAAGVLSKIANSLAAGH